MLFFLFLARLETNLEMTAFSIITPDTMEKESFASSLSTGKQFFLMSYHMDVYSNGVLPLLYCFVC